MSAHKFNIGQSVHYIGGGAGNVYKIVQTLPPEDGVLQYRIKSAYEPHQRLVKEHELYPDFNQTPEAP